MKKRVMTTEREKLKAVLEAVLFASGEPLDMEKTAKTLLVDKATVENCLSEIAEEYKKTEHGIELLNLAGKYQFATKEEHAAEIRAVLSMKKNSPLSSAAFEVLAIVAYNQPVTRAFVDTLRRVDSSYAMNNLLDRGLITATGRLDVPGRPMLYGTTSDFLRCFGLSDLDSLPKTSDELIEVFEGARIKEDLNEDVIEDSISNGEQLTLDIEAPLEAANAEDESAEPMQKPEEEVPEVIVEYDEPSADDDIHED